MARFIDAAERSGMAIAVYQRVLRSINVAIHAGFGTHEADFVENSTNLSAKFGHCFLDHDA